MQKENQLIVDTALLAGKLLMKNGSETDRVEDTMVHILRNALPTEQAESVRVFVMLNGIFVSISSLHTSFLPIKTRNYNLDKLAQINQISRDFAENKCTLEEVWTRLQVIDETPEQAITGPLLLAAALLGGATAPLFGGVMADVPAAALAAVVSYLVYHSISKFIDIPFVCEFFASFCGGAAGIFFFQLLGVNPSKIMMGAVIPLVPGIAITNAIRDMMRRHYLTGLIRFVESMFIGASLGGGITLVLVLLAPIL